jgi:hypothetical protein
MNSTCARMLLAAVSVIPAMAADGDNAAKHEIGLTLGGLLGQDRSGGSTTFHLSSGTALQANYGYRFFDGGSVVLYGEVHMLANPQRVVTSATQTLTRDVATLFVTPGIRVQFAPRHALSPYFAVGGGWALFEQSTTTLGGNPNPAPRDISHAVVDFGGGVDVKFWKFVGLRGEIRDFYSGSPSYNAPAISGGQHNVVVGGGFVLKFR